MKALRIASFRLLILLNVLALEFAAGKVATPTADNHVCGSDAGASASSPLQYFLNPESAISKIVESRYSRRTNFAIIRAQIR
ncbi:hypothetical protein [Cupriavidus metallidurans]|uniref:hypothetical protein n=1 Tax=Cupriavidus metallidurans TaxID=119219 RepID=UPI001CC9A131|nr:hypothetical protein [Cupriavidus metallidurans]UBM09075.1 hypothetical protein LAI70_04070 [Cupriavidus metallidurans]